MRSIPLQCTVFRSMILLRVSLDVLLWSSRTCFSSAHMCVGSFTSRRGPKPPSHDSVIMSHPVDDNSTWSDSAVKVHGCTSANKYLGKQPCCRNLLYGLEPPNNVQVMHGILIPRWRIKLPSPTVLCRSSTLVQRCPTPDPYPGCRFSLPD